MVKETAQADAAFAEAEAARYRNAPSLIDLSLEEISLLCVPAVVPSPAGAVHPAVNPLFRELAALEEQRRAAAQAAGGQGAEDASLDDAIDQLVAMGFERKASQGALKRCAGDVQRAVAELAQ